MFKVSFKEGAKKVQVFNERATIVTLEGYVHLPRFWNNLPYELQTWAWNHLGFDGHSIEVQGKAVCAKGDTFNPIVGERIAESKAKIKLYSFMYKLCVKLSRYYYNILFGNTDVDGFIDPEEGHKVVGLADVVEKYSWLLTKESRHLDKLLEEA